MIPQSLFQQINCVGANMITNIVDSDFFFNPNTELDPVVQTSVENSIEITNVDPITTVNSSITMEELKQRAIAQYSAQNRAVTKQDYESLVYNMPSKFGAVKRANIVNDPSSSNRRISLYVIGENSETKLAPVNTAVKNNLKNWLLSYKMLNDIVDIMNAKIINFSVDFVATVDNRFDSDSVLIECIQKLQDYFSEVSYVGEPIYISRIYQALNEVEGGLDTKKVSLTNETGGAYSSSSLNFDDMLSRDGTFIKMPKNVIAELKYPSLDIRGTVK